MGKIDEDGRYVPRIPAYRYKNKKGHVQPRNLDIDNIYVLNRRVYRGGQEYPYNEWRNKYAKTTSYIKFYPDGRYLKFGRPARDSLGNSYQLKIKDLNPSKHGGPNRGYYFSSDGKKVSTEGFYRGDGSGTYIRFTYHLSTTGDTLTRMDDNTYEVYVKEILADSLRQEYEIDW